MIIVKLIGGLGNQMFQYAVGRRAAHINNTKLKLDTTGYEKQNKITPRKYSLDVFNIEENFATKKEINRLKKHNIIQRISSKIYPVFVNKSYVKEKSFNFDPDILNASDNTYLEGYWACEKYFNDVENIIRKEFTFKNQPNTISQQTINQIKRCDSVSIHIRRGDYVEDKKTNQTHGICSLDYYRRSIEYIVSKIKNPHLYIFSDDSKWVKQNFKVSYLNTVVDCNFKKKDYEDMRLMSKCKHNIIANSSFSWWGAWLNNNKNKIVITPKKWFNNKTIDTKDLIPQSWIKI